MHGTNLEPWSHDHVFGQDERKDGEARTMAVIALTAATMVAEVAAGLVTGSMALLADGLHMASHTAALGLAAFAYRYARRHAGDPRFSFGTGKVNALAGFTGAIFLLVFALWMAVECIGRFLEPVPIDFDVALFVAVGGLLINGLCAVILGFGHHHHQDGVGHVHRDHNLWSAYLHVLADALTSLVAIVALLAGKYYDAVWLDPAAAMVAMVLVVRWSVTLIRDSAKVLLDWQGPEALSAAIKDSIQATDGNRISDLHLWSIGQALYAAEIAVVTDRPKSAQHYKDLLAHVPHLAHVTVEVHYSGAAAAQTKGN